MMFFGRKSGFTLTELLIVVVIIAVIATFALPGILKSLEKAKVGEAIANLNLIRTGQKIYFLQYRTFSPDIASLNIDNPNDETSRYFYYEISESSSADFTAKATRGGTGAQPAAPPYDTHEYTISKDGVITGDLL